MAKQGAGLTLVAKAVAAAYAAAHSTGDLLDDVCKAVEAQFKGEQVPEEAAGFIVDEVARLRSWSASAAKVRKSEMRAILSVYDTLPDAMKKLREHKKNEKPVTFEAGLKLARALKKGATITQAVAAYIEGGKAGTPPAERDLETSMKSAKTHINRVLEHKALPIKFRNALREVCEEHGIVL